MGKEKLTLTIMLSNNRMIHATLKANEVNIKNIEEQFKNKSDFITFGTVGVRRELIDSYIISEVPKIL